MSFTCPYCEQTHDESTDLCPNTGLTISMSYRRIGRLLAGKYRIISLLGEGGMGAVYKAEHVEIGKVLAVKILHERFAEHREMVERFIREAKAAARVGHEHIIDVHDVGREADDTVFMVQELLRGETLEGMSIRGNFGYETSCHIMLQVLSALSAAHAVSIVHRDLKPENIFLTKVGEQPCFVKVLDFGLAKVLGAKPKHSLTRDGVMMGTPIYMSPEQVSGLKDVDHRTDIYSCGVILYRLLAGRLPFEASNLLALCTQINNEEPPWVAECNPRIPSKLSQAVMKAISKRAEDRFQSCGDFAEIIRPFAAHDLTKFHYFATELESSVDTIPQQPRTPMNWSTADIDELRLDRIAAEHAGAGKPDKRGARAMAACRWWSRMARPTPGRLRRTRIRSRATSR